MVSNINAYKHIPEYQILQQKFDPSLKAPKGVIQKALKWIEKKVDSLSYLFKNPTTIAQEKQTKIINQVSKLNKLKQNYENVNIRMEHLTYQLNRLPIQFEKKKKNNMSKITTCREGFSIRFNLQQEKLKIQKELRSELDYIESLYSFKNTIELKIAKKIQNIANE
jgi:hypothetical protein